MLIGRCRLSSALTEKARLFGSRWHSGSILLLFDRFSADLLLVVIGNPDRSEEERILRPPHVRNNLL